MATKIGTKASETINGTSSNDIIDGRGGDDILYGLAGNDFLYGGLGNDNLIGGPGKDTLTGGPGVDFFVYQAFSDSRGANVDLIKDLDLSFGDTVVLTALGTATHQASYNPGFTGLQAVFSYNAATNVTTLSYYEGSSTPIFQLKFTGNIHYDKNGFLGIDPSSSPTEGDDVVVGTANADTVDLLGGDDTYHGWGGNDSVAGGSGEDDIFGEDGDDKLQGGSGIDRITGGEGNDSIYGGAEMDFLQGGPGNDAIHAGAGDDPIGGGDGDDFIWGDMGNDILNGGAGNDRLNGGGGYDYAIADDPGSSFDEYSITKNADGSITLTDLEPVGDAGTDTGTDTLIKIEAIAFFDGTYDVATGIFTPHDSII